MSRRALPLCWLCLLGAPARGAELLAIEERSVVAWPDLALRSEPREDAAVLARVPFGAIVTVQTNASPGPTQVVAGLEGRWHPARAGFDEGWMFDAWLLPLPGPPPSCTTPADWAERWSPEGPAMLERVEGPAGMTTLVSQHYVGGMVWRHPGEGAVGERELWLPGVTPSQGWLAVRRCLPELGALVAQGWPPSSAAGLAVRRAADNVSVGRHGEPPLLVLERGEGGLWVRW